MITSVTHTHTQHFVARTIYSMLEKEGDYLVTWSFADGNFNVFTVKGREACPRLCLPIPTKDIYIEIHEPLLYLTKEISILLILHKKKIYIPVTTLVRKLARRYACGTLEPSELLKKQKKYGEYAERNFCPFIYIYIYNISFICII